MIRRIVICCAMLISVMNLSAGSKKVGNWHVIPLPQSVDVLPLPGFQLSSATSIVYTGDGDVKRNAHYLQTFIKEMCGIEVAMQSKKAKQTITLSLSKDVSNEEGYRIHSRKNGVVIEAATPKGMFYGIQTFGKALPVVKGVKKVVMPAVDINDYPRFGYRGFLIDVGRHFFSVAYLKEIIDMLALHNINYFHWHLTEDQGWRIEIKKYPRLTEVGSYRKGTVVAPGSKEVDDVPVSGYYTQEEAREIVRYAAQRYITVIPEIDMPGHTLAALTAYPELGCTGGPYEIPTRFGVFDDVLCGGNPKTLQFAKDVLNEIMDIFPSPYIHIGGDECPKKRWKECPVCQAKIKELGLRDTLGHTKENQLQANFMSELEKLINARGRKVMGWDEVLEGNAPRTTTVMAWTKFDAARQAAELGYPTIVCPITNFYFSNPRWNKLTGVKSIERVYELNPIAAGLTPDQQKNIIGEEGCIWTEWTKDSVKMEWQMFPRMAALCENQWTNQGRKNFDSFLTRLPHMLEIYKLKGYCIKEDIYDVSIYEEDKKGSDVKKVTLRTFDNAPIRYTVDGTVPTAASPLYENPFEVSKDVKVRAVAIRK